MKPFAIFAFLAFVCLAFVCAVGANPILYPAETSEPSEPSEPNESNKPANTEPQPAVKPDSDLDPELNHLHAVDPPYHPPTTPQLSEAEKAEVEKARNAVLAFHAVDGAKNFVQSRLTTLYDGIQSGMKGIGIALDIIANMGPF